MKNRFVAKVFFICTSIFATVTGVVAQESVSFNKNGISVVFKILATSPDATKQSFGGVYFTGFNETEKESRVHRVLADRASGTYFGYDLVIESVASTLDKFKVSIKPLSIKPPETMRLSDLTALTLPKYPADMVVADSDSIAIDVLVNPQTKVNIVDYIKITTKKPRLSDSSPLNTAVKASSSDDRGLFGKQKTRDFTPNDVKLRLTSPEFLVGGTVSPLLGSRWEGIIEGSIVHVYIPEKGRFIFSLYPQSNFNFQKSAAIEDNKIVFQSDGQRYELTSAAPIVGFGGSWNLWILHDSDYRPDLILSAEASNYIEYGASNDVESVLKQEWRKSRLHPVLLPTARAEIYSKWLGEIRYIISDSERQGFLQLKSDEEREQFIESFWRRRDSNPETPKYEFRREYYNRIAYANQNFSFGEKTGWQTDRGRILITHGKPDEIERTQSGEVWIYKSLPELGDNVRFTFFDAAKSGDFRLRQ